MHTRAIVASIALWAASAAFAGPDPGAVKRELWSAEVSVGQARLGLHALQAVIGDAQAYDPAVAEELRGRAASDLRASEQGLGRLWRIPGQDDARLHEVSRLTDAVHALRERVERLGRSTTAHTDPRPDTRQGAGQKPRQPPEGTSMPAASSGLLRGTDAELKAAWEQIEDVASSMRRLAELYGVSDDLVAP